MALAQTLDLDPLLDGDMQVISAINNSWINGMSDKLSETLRIVISYGYNIALFFHFPFKYDKLSPVVMNKIIRITEKFNNSIKSKCQTLVPGA